MSIISCIFEAIFDFSHEQSLKRSSIFSHEADTVNLTEENDIILHRFAGASLCRMIKVRRNTINGKKGTRKITNFTREKMELELKLLNDLKRDSLDGLPHELTLHLNEGGLMFVKDEILEFVRLADRSTRKLTTLKVFQKSTETFLDTVFNSVYNSQDISDCFSKVVKVVSKEFHNECTTESVFQEFLTKICRTRVKVFLEGMKESNLKSEKKVCDVDSSLRDKLKGYVQASKRV